MQLEKHYLEYRGDGKLNVCVVCPTCKVEQVIVVEEQAYRDWKGGGLVQNCFPDLDYTRREILLSGICPPCWDTMYKPEEEEEGEGESYEQ